MHAACFAVLRLEVILRILFTNLGLARPTPLSRRSPLMVGLLAVRPVREEHGRNGSNPASLIAMRRSSERWRPVVTRG